MPSLVENIRHQFSLAYHWAEDTGVKIQRGVSQQVQRTQACAREAYCSMGQKLSAAYKWTEEKSVSVRTTVSRKIQATRASVIDTYQSIGLNCRKAAEQAKLKYRETADKVAQFIYLNKGALFLAACSLTTAYFSPIRFFPSLLIGAVVRLEISHNLKKAADYYLKDERNPYKLSSKYENCVSRLDVAMGTIAAIDAIALATLFVTNSWTIALLPALGGLAAGSALAKWGMNLSNFLG